MFNINRIFLKLLLIGGLILCSHCKSPPSYPKGEEFPIYVQTLMQGFDIGVDDSKQKRDWLLDLGGFMRLEYPGDLEWGCVFIVVAMVPFTDLSEDFSKYKSFSIDLKGIRGGEEVGITLEDSKKQSNWTEFISDLDTDWKTYEISLEKFLDVDLRNLRVIFKIKLIGHEPQTIDFRNLKYSTIPVDNIPPKTYYILKEDQIICDCDIGCNTSSGLTDWIFIEDSSWKVAFPPNQDWATVFILCDPPLNLSYYNLLSLEFKSEFGNEKISIAVNDTIGEDPTQISSILWNFPSEWKEETFRLFHFKQVDLTKIYIPIQFINRQSQAKTIYFKNVKYIHNE